MAARSASMRTAALALLRALASARLASLLGPVCAVLYAGLGLAAGDGVDEADDDEAEGEGEGEGEGEAWVAASCALAIMLAKRLLAASSSFCGTGAATNSLALRLCFDKAGLLFRVLIMLRVAFNVVFCAMFGWARTCSLNSFRRLARPRSGCGSRRCGRQIRRCFFGLCALAH